jgi:hypothetical protein
MCLEVVAWIAESETPRTEVRVSGKELAKLVEDNQVGDNGAYRTWHGG